MPPNRRATELSACSKLPNTRWHCSAVMPMPVSRTARRRRGSPSEPATVRTLITTSPTSVNLMALPPRLSSTCLSRRASPSTVIGRPGSRSNTTSTSRGPTMADSTTPSSFSSASSAKGCSSSVSLPASMREKSNRSLRMPSSSRAEVSALLA